MFASVSPLNEQPCRKRWRGGEEALQRQKRMKGQIWSLQRRGQEKSYVTLQNFQLFKGKASLFT